MNVIVDDSLNGMEDIRADLPRINEQLNNVISLPDWPVNASWTTDHDDNGREEMVLSLSDDVVKVSTRFSKADLAKSEDEVEKKLRRLWDNFLSVRLRRQIQKLNEMARQLEE